MRLGRNCRSLSGAHQGTVPRWTQRVGKDAFGAGTDAEPWWNVPLYVNSVGLKTLLMPPTARTGLEIVLEFVRHQLVVNADRWKNAHPGWRLVPCPISTQYVRKPPNWTSK